MLLLPPIIFLCVFSTRRILSHGYVLTGYLPPFFAKAFFMSLLPTVCAVDHDVLMESFIQYIDPSEAEAINKCLQENENTAVPEFEDVVFPC